MCDPNIKSEMLWLDQLNTLCTDVAGAVVKDEIYCLFQLDLGIVLLPEQNRSSTGPGQIVKNTKDLVSRLHFHYAFRFPTAEILL